MKPQRVIPALVRGGDLPLIDAERALMLIFSPKSACTSAVIWFLNQLGLADEARAHHRWPHKYRIERFYRRPEFLAAREIPLDRLRIVRIVRDPLDRAASSFRHALATGYADDALQARLGIDPAREGLSFGQFVDFLEAEDLDACNPHHRRQKHPIEALRQPDRVINVSRENLFDALNAFEREHDLAVTDFRALAWIHELHDTRGARLLHVAGNTARRQLTREQARGGPWPTRLMNPSIARRLAALYAEDLALYGGSGAMRG